MAAPTRSRTDVLGAGPVLGQPERAATVPGEPDRPPGRRGGRQLAVWIGFRGADRNGFIKIDRPGPEILDSDYYARADWIESVVGNMVTLNVHCDELIKEGVGRSRV